MQKQLIGVHMGGGVHASCCYFSFGDWENLPLPTLNSLAALLSKCSENVIHSSIGLIFTEHPP